MKNFGKPFILIISFFLVNCQSLNKSQEHLALASAVRSDSSVSQASGSHFAVATQGIYATEAAKKIYQLGGNAIDAAIAASFTISVERPHSTGIGGGGFMLYREGKSQKVYAIDFRERAPLQAKNNMFINDQGQADDKLSQNGILASAVPGLVAGLVEIHQKFGRLPLYLVMTPAIELAEKGFAIYPSLYKALKQKEQLLAKDRDASRIFLDENLQARAIGTLLIQKDLAKTLRLISHFGKEGFYSGETAGQIVQFFKTSKGLINADDLKSYTVKWREPLKASYKEYTIFSMPPPSSGGVHVIQFLNMLENDQLKDTGVLSAISIHKAASALQSAFSDRARYLGDPDFVSVPTGKLISKEYAQFRRSQFNVSMARKESEVDAGNIHLVSPEHTETTHISIMDKNGDTISTTQTINGYMGASIVVPGTGIVLNNEMDDFTAKVGASNLFGAVGGSANMIAPKKTPLSSMSPTIVTKNNEAVLSLGAPGGTRIISCVAQTILNYLEFKLPLYESIATVRYHHQWKPDVLEIDPPGPTAAALAELQKMRYNVRLNPVACNVMAVAKEARVFKAVADPRDIGTSNALD